MDLVSGYTPTGWWDSAATVKTVDPTRSFWGGWLRFRQQANDSTPYFERWNVPVPGCGWGSRQHTRFEL